MYRICGRWGSWDYDCMVIMMGPTVDYVGKIFNRKKNKVENANG